MNPKMNPEGAAEIYKVGMSYHNLMDADIIPNYTLPYDPEKHAAVDDPVLNNIHVQRHMPLIETEEVYDPNIGLRRNPAEYRLTANNTHVNRHIASIGTQEQVYHVNSNPYPVSYDSPRRPIGMFHSAIDNSFVDNPSPSYGNKENVDTSFDLSAKVQKAIYNIVKLEKANCEQSYRLQEAKSELHLIYQEFKKLQGSRSAIELLKLQKELEQVKQERDNYRCMIGSLQEDFENYQAEQSYLARDAEEHLRTHEQIYSQFSFAELSEATESFSESSKIGEGQLGCVYKGTLRNTTVAIKLLKNEGQQGLSQFEQEVKVLSEVRHPHLVTLLGACSEPPALVYEYLPNGSLDDRLACNGDTLPLTWQIRSRIIGEICSALMFLHSNKPQPVVHGGLKPTSILLDANLVCKLSDFGLALLLIDPSMSNSTMVFLAERPTGSGEYIDPEFVPSGELTLKSDVYAFGIIILRLLTGKPPRGIVGLVEEALVKDELPTILDSSAGEWPFVQAKQLASIGIRCAQMTRRMRPDLASEVWPVVGPIAKSASLSATPSTSLLAHEDSRIPSYFFCPITQDIMSDPHIAADGHTYEAEALKGWLEQHNTSPMTNLPLSNCDLIPNIALRSAIKEYLQRRS